MQKILTVIIPAYNMEKYLERCLQSLLVEEEQLAFLDILVVNDGSKDSTSKIGHRYQDLYPGTIRIIDKENGHYGSCINRGLDEAKGLFVKILDADDTFDTQVFGKYLSFLCSDEVKESADVVLSDFVEVDDNNTLIGLHPYSDYSKPFTLEELTPDDTMRWFTSGLTYRTDMLRERNYVQTEGIAYTDAEWNFYPTAGVRQVFRFNGYLYRYTKLREGQSVEDAVHGKNIWMEAEVTRKIIQKANAVVSGANPENVSFIKSLTELNVTHIYQLYLLTLYPYVTSFDPLKEIDRELMEYLPELHRKVEGYSTRISGLTFYPVRDWRKGRKVSLLLQRRLYRLMDKKNKLLRSIKRKAQES